MALAVVAHVFDRLREPTLALLARSAWWRESMRSRQTRIEVMAVLGVSSALVAALAAPALLWLWGPLLLGVPHLVADLRYLVLPPYSPVVVLRRDIVIGALLAATLWSASPEVGGAAVVAAWALAPRPRSSHAMARRALVGAVVISGYAVSWRYSLESSYVLVHAHNAVAVLLFAWVFARGRVRVWLPVALATASALVLTGALDSLLAGNGLDVVAGYLLPVSALERWPAEVCARLAVLFVFLQSVHYAIWLRLVPEQARPRAGQRSFRGSLAALQRDFGGSTMALFAALSVALLAFGLHDAERARTAYLRFAGFHAYLELAFLVRWLCAARAPRPGALGLGAPATSIAGCRRVPFGSAA